VEFSTCGVMLVTQKFLILEHLAFQVFRLEMLNLDILVCLLVNHLSPPLDYVLRKYGTNSTVLSVTHLVSRTVSATEWGHKRLSC
jgi:hypothetical protein